MTGRSPVADLHVHTTASDGTLTIDSLVPAAIEAGLELVAVTDHDVLHPELDAPVLERDGVTIVRGIELRVEADVGRVDLLGYGVEPTPELRAELERIQTDRIERGAAIIEAVEARLGVELDVEPREGLGRPHIARAIERSEAPYDVERAFEELIGDDGPCFVPRDVTPFDRGRRLLTACCSIVGLAHPFRYDDPSAAIELAAPLDAIERYYPYGFEVDPTPIETAIERYGLLALGGSDAHDDRLGRAGLDRTETDAIRARLAV